MQTNCLYKQLDCMPSHHPRDDKTPQQVVDEFLKVCGGKKPKLLFRNKLQVKYGQSDMEFYDCFYPNDYTEGNANFCSINLM